MAGNTSDDTGIESKDTQSTKSTKSIRGKIYLNDLAKRKAKGIRQEVNFNNLGQPIGPAASEMQSYIGVLARKEVKITYKTWRDVPSEVKELIWESVNLSYIVDPKWRSGCLESANAKWRQWKSKLYIDFILPNKDNPSMLNDPPPTSCISPEDWSRFVISRLSDEFKKLSERQKESRKHNIFPHRLSRTGYAGLAEKMKDELCGDDDIDRAVMWKKARVRSDKEIEDDKLKKAVERIDDYIRQKEEGVFKSPGVGEDLLICALEKPDHSGRVRAIGSYVTPSVYFKYPKQGRRSMKHGAHVESLETKKQLDDHKALISELYNRIGKLEANMAKDKEIDEKGSCSVKGGKCELTDDDHDDEVVMLVDKLDALQGELVALSLASSNHIVAYGTIVSTLSGDPIPKDCTRVLIDEVLDPEALLAHPIPDICENVADALGSHVAWPTHLVVVKDKRPTDKVVKKVRVVKKKLIRGYEGLNPSLKALYCYSEGALKNGEGILLTLDDDVFGDKCDIYIHLEDVIPFCELEPISGNCMVAYIWKMYKELSAACTLNRFRFVNPFSISYVPKSSMNVRTQLLADRLYGVCANQLVIVPCNVGHHWILTIIDPHKALVYLLDPLGCRNRDESWKNVVEMAINLFNASLGKKGKKQPTWEIIKAPRQPDSKQCGFYVLRFMKEIIEGLQGSDSISLRSLFKKDKYLLKDIDEVRMEWANFVLHYI